jgi:hypothetical protein
VLRRILTRESKRTRGTERSGEPQLAIGRKPVGLCHLPVGILIWDSIEPESVGTTPSPPCAPQVRKECTMNTAGQQIDRFLAIDAHKHYLIVGGLTAPQLVRI